MSLYNMTAAVQRQNKVLLIYTGGTIGMGKNPKTGALEPLDFQQLSMQVPEFEWIPTGIDVYQFTPPIDSSDMTPRLWAQLVRIIADRYEQYDGFVILHGTDTMAFTASALSFMLENLTKPVILTGSQLPIGQLRTDGKENLITSIEIAAAHHDDGTPIVPEVCIYFSGKLLRGNRSTKINADGFNAFDSFNYPHLGDAGINIVYHEEYILQPDYTRRMVPHYATDPNVVVFTLFPGIQDNIVRNVLDAPELRSIVMRTYGSGNAPQRPWLMQMLKDAAYRGVNIVNISQCAAGTVEMARYDTGFQLKNAGVISGYDSTVESAVTKLMHLQGHYADAKTVRHFMNRNMRGEITLPHNA
jgi:L-asparaginase